MIGKISLIGLFLLLNVGSARADDTRAALSSVDIIATLKAEVERLKMAERRLESDYQTLEYQLQQAQTELQTARATIDMMQVEMRERLAAVQTRPRSTAAVIPTAPAPVTSSHTGRRHTVAAGETLSVLAARYYGTGGQWRKIYEANQDKLESPNVVRSGMVLVIP